MVQAHGVWAGEQMNLPRQLEEDVLQFPIIKTISNLKFWIQIAGLQSHHNLNNTNKVTTSLVSTQSANSKDLQ